MHRIGDLDLKLANKQVAGSGRVVTSVEPGSTATIVAPDSIVAAYGAQLATGTADNGGSLSTTLGGTTVTITDSSAKSSPALLFYVSPGQVNYAVPATVALGPATVVVKAGDSSTSTGLVSVQAIEPRPVHLQHRRPDCRLHPPLSRGWWRSGFRAALHPGQRGQHLRPPDRPLDRPGLPWALTAPEYAVPRPAKSRSRLAASPRP